MGAARGPAPYRPIADSPPPGCSSLHPVPKSRRASPIAFPYNHVLLSLWQSHRRDALGDKTDVWQGTLALMVLRTLETMGPLHGYGLARRIEQTSGQQLVVNYGTLYPALLKLEQEGYVSSAWGVSENNRRAKFYRLTRAGRRQLRKQTEDWAQTRAILERFLTGESS